MLVRDHAGKRVFRKVEMKDYLQWECHGGEGGAVT